MKTSTSILITLGLASHAALAQVQTLPQEPQPPSDVQMQPGPATPSLPGWERQPGMTSPSDAGSTSGSSAAPDASSGSSPTPADSQAGTVPDPSSGGSNGMQSEAGMDLRATTPDTTTAGLKPMVQGDVTYLCGGIGDEETAFMKQQARDYDLMLTFAARDGAYLADVNVDIADAKGNSVLQVNCDAPIMLVDLPRSGNYRVSADAAGYTLQRTVRVSAAKKSRQSVASTSLVWPQQVAEGVPSSDTATGASGGEGAGQGGANDSGAR